MVTRAWWWWCHCCCCCCCCYHHHYHHHYHCHHHHHHHRLRFPIAPSGFCFVSCLSSVCGECPQNFVLPPPPPPVSPPPPPPLCVDNPTSGILLDGVIATCPEVQSLCLNPLLSEDGQVNDTPSVLLQNCPKTCGLCSPIETCADAPLISFQGEDKTCDELVDQCDLQGARGTSGGRGWWRGGRGVEKGESAYYRRLIVYKSV